MLQTWQGQIFEVNGGDKFVESFESLVSFCVNSQHAGQPSSSASQVSDKEVFETFVSYGSAWYIQELMATAILCYRNRRGQYWTTLFSARFAELGIGEQFLNGEAHSAVKGTHNNVRKRIEATIRPHVLESSERMNFFVLPKVSVNLLISSVSISK